jgi:hypothetical protein
MTVKFLAVVVLASTMALCGAVGAAEDEHQHEAKVFASVAAGLTSLDGAVASAKSKAAAGDMKALGAISEDLHGIAEGLGKRLPDVAAENRERFKFNVAQIDALHGQLEAAQEDKDTDGVNRVIKRLEDVAGRLKALAPAK